MINQASLDLGRSLTFSTDIHLEDFWSGRYKKAFIPIYPATRVWNITLLTCFLNEMDVYKKASRRAFIHETQSDAQKFKFESELNGNIFVDIVGNHINVIITHFAVLMNILHLK